MKTYRITVDWVTEVEAENKDEALEKGIDAWRDVCEEGMNFKVEEIK